MLTPVNAVLAGRRNNPPDRGAGIRSLAVYNPIHHMELPELFMEFICSMTGKSPSTTGAGSEGALTKGPFNALPPIYDLNSAFVGYAVSGYDGFVTAAGYVGPHARVDHDISLLVPEVWCRMTVEERSPEYLLAGGYLEPVRDFEHEGRRVLASRLGNRITKKFVNTFFGRVFNHPHVVLTGEMLRPELQGLETFVEGMDNIVATQKRVAAHYFSDGSIEWACPPLKVLLHIMRDDHYEGRTLDDPEIRAMFSGKACRRDVSRPARGQAARGRAAVGGAREAPRTLPAQSQLRRRGGTPRGAGTARQSRRRVAKRAGQRVSGNPRRDDRRGAVGSRTRRPLIRRVS